MRRQSRQNLLLRFSDCVLAMKRKLEDDHDLDPPSKRSARHEESSDDDDDDDVEDHDWETVEVPDTDRPVYHDVEVVFEAPRAVLK